MGDLDRAKGRSKEAAGDLTGDKELKREGKLDQVEAKIKDAVDEARDKVSELLDKAKSKKDRPT